MSEHLAAMNEKLSQQKDEIDALKYELSSKVAVCIIKKYISNFVLVRNMQLINIFSKWNITNVYQII